MSVVEEYGDDRATALARRRLEHPGEHRIHVQSLSQADGEAVKELATVAVAPPLQGGFYESRRDSPTGHRRQPISSFVLFSNTFGRDMNLTKLLVVICFHHGNRRHVTRAAEPVDYQRDVFPILESYCLGCHTSDEAEGGLVMESHADLMAGGESGVAVTAGSPSSSRLLLMIRGEVEPVMPPEGEARPSEEEIET